MFCFDYSESTDCVNPESYGEICIMCGCCSINPDYRDRTIRKICLYKYMINKERNFDMWDEDTELRKNHERNVKLNILYFKREIRKCRKVLKCLKKG